MKRILITLGAILALATSAQAQEKFLVATGDSKSGSTYSQMFREFQARCSTASLGLAERETGGSVDNVNLLTGNQVNAAVVQSDLLFFTKMTDEAKVANVRTLVALHPEELHFIARGDVKKEGGFMGIGGKEVVFRTVEDLKGRNVGAVGGSALSGRVFSSQSKLNFNVVVFPDNNALTKALLEGQVDTILVVAGAPAKAISALDGRFRVLPVTPEITKAVAGVYSPAKLSYSTLGAAGVPTVATQALLVSRVYRSTDMQDQLAKLRACFAKQLPNIQDSTGTHPKWQVVDAANQGKWAYYDLPSK
jgi:uncharacterized protein